MALEKHYRTLWENSLAGFRAGAFELDPFLSAKEDSRFGITLLFRPGEAVKAGIAHFLQELRQLEPEQYYYPASDMHVTVMSLISCHAGFRLEHINPEAYITVLQECLACIKSFRVDFAGITASPSSLMVQGFPGSDQLDVLRGKLRENFRNSPLLQTIDSRYVLQTAHCTVARFTSPLKHASAFLGKVQQCRGCSFGGAQVEEVELVYNDWYQRQAVVKPLASFRLK